MRFIKRDYICVKKWLGNDFYGLQLEKTGRGTSGQRLSLVMNIR